jgi:hypothetical protein
MRKILFLALCSLCVAGCVQSADDKDLSDYDSPKRPRPPHRPPPDASEPPPGCADVAQFDLGVFEDEIMPILTGEVDLNDPGAGHVGCTRTECHGRDRGPDHLFLKASDTAANNLSRFVCFVDLDDAPASQMLVCPLNDPGCVAYPHPGPAIFTGDDDLNYQRVLSYVEDSALAGSTL